MACLAAAPMILDRPPSAPSEVELLEDDVALVIDLATDEAFEVARSGMPEGVHEGDVIVDGRVDPVLTEQFREEIEKKMGDVLTPSNGGFDL
jgi:hypothetical protein